MVQIPSGGGRPHRKEGTEFTIKRKLVRASLPVAVQVYEILRAGWVPDQILRSTYPLELFVQRLKSLTSRRYHNAASFLEDTITSAHGLPRKW